jgi:hypothetical protein
MLLDLARFSAQSHKHLPKWPIQVLFSAWCGEAAAEQRPWPCCVRNLSTVATNRTALLNATTGVKSHRPGVGRDRWRRRFALDRAA